MADDPRQVWKEQLVERNSTMTTNDFPVRAATLRGQTRYEILVSTAATLAICGLQFWLLPDDISTLLRAGFGAIAFWAVTTVVAYRKRIRTAVPEADGMAASSVDYYRSLLADRRTHLAVAWAWRGPVFVAMALFVWALGGRAILDRVPLSNLALFGALGMAWAILAIRQHRAAVRSVEMEMRELDASR